jgi:hypothetical protein
MGESTAEKMVADRLMNPKQLGICLHLALLGILAPLSKRPIHPQAIWLGHWDSFQPFIAMGTVHEDGWVEVTQMSAQQMRI